VLFVLALACPILVAQQAHAEEGEKQPATVFGGSLAAAYPTGDFGDAAGLGLGGFMHVAKFLGPHFAFSGSFGLLYHLDKKSTQITEVPLLAGASYFFGDERQVEFFGQVGIVTLRSSVELEIASFTESETKFGSQWGAGVRVGPGMIRASILIPSVPDVDEGFNLMGSYQLAIVNK
jgi:hypothetical protein